jgi:hypothetical protein
MGATSTGRGRMMMASALLICAVAVVSLSPTAAWGQESSAAITVSAVAVLDFVNNSGYGGDAIGRSAADALVLAMDESKRFEPLKRAEVDQALSRLGFSTSLGQTAQARLGRELEVTEVASGTINGVHFEQTDQGRIAVVDITVMLLSVDSEEFSNGSRVVKGSTPKPGYTADDAALVDEALSLAGYQAVRNMISYRLPRITVLSATPSDAYLNAGSRSGLQEGMELVVMRFGDKVGRLRVSNVEPTDATAAIIANYRGIAAGDIAVPVFTAPSTTMATAVQRSKNRSRLGAAVLGIAAAVGIFATMSTHGPADQAVPDVIATSLSEPSGTGRVPGVLVTWSPYHHEQQNVLAYEVWRNGTLMYVQPSQTTGTSSYTGSGEYIVDTTYTGLLGSTQIDIDPTTGKVIAFQTPPNSPPTEPISAPQTYYRLPFQTAPEAGLTYVYNIVGVVAEIEFSPTEGGTTGGTTTGGTVLSRAASDVTRQEAPPRQWVIKMSPFRGAGVATALDAPLLTSPSPGTEITDLAEVVFTWSAVDMADQYVLQICRDGLFQAVNTKTFTIDGSFPLDTTMTQTVNVGQIFPPPPSGGVLTLHWRVGARNTQDPLPPRTDPSMFQAFPQHQGYVWSNPGNSTFFFTGTSTTTASGRAPRRIRLLAPTTQ